METNILLAELNLEIDLYVYVYTEYEKSIGYQCFHDKYIWKFSCMLAFYRSYKDIENTVWCNY